MKHLAAALVVIALIAAAVIAHLNDLPKWDTGAVLACIFFTILVFKKDN